MSTTRGTVLIIAGPSGAGKTTVCRCLLEARPELRFSVSCTTRARRPGETDGHDYHYITRADFEARIRADAFLEHADVHGNLYGTLRQHVEAAVADGSDVLLDIDVQGTRLVRRSITDSALAGCTVFVFFAPPSFGELEQRLRGRGTESEDVISRRLANARGELAAWREFDHVVVNETIDAATTQLGVILDACRTETRRLTQAPFEDGQSGSVMVRGVRGGKRACGREEA